MTGPYTGFMSTGQRAVFKKTSKIMNAKLGREVNILKYLEIIYSITNHDELQI